MARPVAFGEGFPSDELGSAPGLSAPLSPEALEAHVQAACDALRSGGTLGVLDLRGHPDAGAAIDVILASASGPGALRLLNLHTLNLEFALRVTDAHVKSLAECGTLVDVNLNATSEVGDEAVMALADLNENTLASVALYWNVRVTDTSIVRLVQTCGARCLKTLNLSGCKRLTDATARAVGKHCVALADLDVTRVAFSDDGVAAVSLAPSSAAHMRRLNLYAAPSLSSARPFRCLAALENLTWLDLCGAQALTDAALTEIADGCPKLRHLNLSWCLGVTDAGVAAACAACRKLELLSVHGNRNVTDACLDVLKRANEGALHTLDVRGCVGIRRGRDELSAAFPNLKTFVHHT
jgi:F-box/leucine-rich repeat protein 2/20